MILWVFIKKFGVKIVITDIYRYLPIFYRYLPIFYRYLPIFTDILPIFFQKFLHKCACSTVAIFRWKNRFFPIFRRKIGDFTDFSPIFPLIDFSSDFSSWCRPKTDFSAKYWPKKPIFCSLAETKIRGTSRKIMSRHCFEVATRKEDIVAHNREMMSRLESNVEWTCNVSAMQFQVATKI